MSEKLEAFEGPVRQMSRLFLHNLCQPCMSFLGAYNSPHQTLTLMLHYKWGGQKEKGDKGRLKAAKDT